MNAAWTILVCAALVPLASAHADPGDVEVAAQASLDLPLPPPRPVAPLASPTATTPKPSPKVMVASERRSPVVWISMGAGL